MTMTIASFLLPIFSLVNVSLIVALLLLAGLLQPLTVTVRVSDLLVEASYANFYADPTCSRSSFLASQNYGSVSILSQNVSQALCAADVETSTGLPASDLIYCSYSASTRNYTYFQVEYVGTANLSGASLLNPSRCPLSLVNQLLPVTPNISYAYYSPINTGVLSADFPGSTASAYDVCVPAVYTSNIGGLDIRSLYVKFNCQCDSTLSVSSAGPGICDPMPAISSSAATPPPGFSSSGSKSPTTSPTNSTASSSTAAVVQTGIPSQASSGSSAAFFASSEAIINPNSTGTGTATNLTGSMNAASHSLKVLSLSLLSLPLLLISVVSFLG